MTTLDVPDDPKMLRETLCVAQTYVGQCGLHRAPEHVMRLERLIAECDHHRPTGPDGKHGNRHTPTCGCEDVVPAAGPVATPRYDDAVVDRVAWAIHCWTCPLCWENGMTAMAYSGQDHVTTSDRHMASFLIGALGLVPVEDLDGREARESS